MNKNYHKCMIFSGKKLAVGKRLTGKGVLTNKLVNKFQTFYGMSIKSNREYVMKKNMISLC